MYTSPTAATTGSRKFSSNGTFITKFGGPGSGDGQFLQPNDVTVDAAGNSLVADTGNDQIQKFAEAGGPPPGGGNTGGAAVAEAAGL